MLRKVRIRRPGTEHFQLGIQLQNENGIRAGKKLLIVCRTGQQNSTTQEMRGGSLTSHDERLRCLIFLLAPALYPAQHEASLMWAEKKPRGQPLYPYASVSVSIGFFSSASVCSVLAALARKSRLFRTSVVCKVHSASSQLQLESRNFSVQVQYTKYILAAPAGK